MTSLDVIARETSIPNSKLIKESKGERSRTFFIAKSRQTIIARLSRETIPIAIE